MLFFRRSENVLQLHAMNETALDAALAEIGRPFAVRKADGAVLSLAESAGRPADAWHVPACPLENLGDRSFCADYGLRYAYLAGAMANGIGSAEIAEALGQAGMISFFGAAGLSPATVEAAIDRLSRNLGERYPFGFNLIHSPNEPDLEAAIVDLVLAARNSPRGGVGLFGPHIAGGAVSGDGDSPGPCRQHRRAESSHCQGLAR